MANSKRKKNSQKEKPQTESPEPTKAVEIAENSVYIGKKPVMNYVVACLTYFNSGSKKLVVKARGRAICRAIDTVEVLRRSFAKDLKLENIAICTEEVTRDEGRKSKVSSVEITLAKP